MEKLAALGAQIVEPDYSANDGVAQKILDFEDLAAHSEMGLQADRYDECFDGLGEENQNEGG